MSHSKTINRSQLQQNA